ncbi:MAG: hypothetical protein ABEL76_00385 [Bradymonadaceae bacterium]
MSKRTEGHLLLSALALVVASAVGCGDSSGSRSDAGPGPPPAVESVEISIDPGRLTYATGDSITATARAFAADDTRLDPFIEIRWSADPSTAIERTGPHSWTFREQGRVELQACAGTVENDRPVCATRTLAVDDAPPSATLNAPEAGALLVGGSSDEIRVTGEVTDTNGTPRARLNGYRVQLDDQGRFETKIDPEFGVNRLRLVATDGRHRSEATVIREFLWAPSYAPLEITPPERRSSSKPSGHRVAFGLDRALVLDLGQRFFDDGQTPSAPEGVRAITHDVANWSSRTPT